MIARVFLSFGRSRPFPSRKPTIARLRKTCDPYCSYLGRSTLSFCSLLSAIQSPLNSIGMLAPNEVNCLLLAGSGLEVKRVSGL
jgi:hypothetical protein